MRGRTAVVVGAGLVLLLGAAGFLVLDTDVRGLLPGAPDCTVTVGEREVGLSSAQAVSAARTTARVVRRGGTPASAAAALDTELPLADRRLVAVRPGRTCARRPDVHAGHRRGARLDPTDAERTGAAGARRTS